MLPGGAAVVVARHPAQARVVSAEFGERRRAGNGIGHVIVAAVGMRDGVPANSAGATLKPYDLALKAIIARQDDAATVQKGRRSRNNSLLVCLARSYAMPCLRNSSRGNSPAYRSPVRRLTR